MKNSKNKFIIWIILLVIITLIVQLYISYFSNKIDTNSYLSLLEWQWTLNEQLLDLNSRSSLESGDKVRIIWDSSLALIEWWDGSITRLAWNTKISIWEANVSEDYTKINISFDLISWKSWSNVVSFLWKDSYFKQSFENVEAWVRGTVFNVDLENNYVDVIDHQVTLTKQDGTEVIISENKPFSLDTFSFIALSDFILNIRDTAWQDVNTTFDQKYIIGLKDSLEDNFKKNNPFTVFLELFSKKYKILKELEFGQDYEKIQKWVSWLSADKKAKLYERVLSDYQKINFVKIDDAGLYEKKTLYKRTLILLSNDTTEKEILLRSTLLDFEDIIKTKSLDKIGGTLSIITENKELLKNLDVKNIISSEDLIPENLKELLGDNFDDIKSLLNIKIPTDISVDSITDLKDKAEEKLTDSLDGVLNLINN